MTIKILPPDSQKDNISSTRINFLPKFSWERKKQRMTPVLSEMKIAHELHELHEKNFK